MALSKQVTESLVEAQGNIRNALAFAARQERTVTVNAIARILNDIETLQSFDEMLDKLDQEIAET
tara:strand:- start:3511 stop:3705 length:195 start_codon:yes stop_codon:yes gene_type:complete